MGMPDLLQNHRVMNLQGPREGPKNVIESCVLLAGQPLMGRERPELAPNLRSFSVGSYVILYRPISEGIEVGRIIHGARDIDAQFRG